LRGNGVSEMAMYLGTLKLDGAAAYKTFADRMPGTAKVVITIAA
jgi:hypothetical protein